MISKLLNILNVGQQPEPQEEDNLPPHIRQKLLQMEKLLKVTPFDFPDQLRKNSEQLLLNFKSNEDPPRIAIFSKQYEEEGPEFMVFEGKGLKNIIIKVLANFKGREYPIQIQIRLPQQFPRDPPLVYLKNMAQGNPQVKINKKYISSEMGEYINISKCIVEVVGWFEHQSMDKVMIGLIETFSNTHPFAEGRSQDDQQINFHKVETKIETQEAPPPIKLMTSGRSVENNPLTTTSETIKPTFHRDIDIFQAKKIQIERDKLKREGEQYLQDLFDILENQKRILQEQKKIEHSLDDNISKANVAINTFQEFNENNKDIRLEMNDVQKYLLGQDALNEQIIDVVSNILGLRDLLRLINIRFKQKVIDLDHLIRLTQKYSEKLFDEELLLKKILKSTI